MPDPYVVEKLRDLIAIPSFTAQEADVADYVERELRGHGIRTERDEHHNVTAFVGSGPRMAVVNGHLDTVPPSSNWTHDPFDPVEKDGLIRGLGASDMKSGIAIMLHLARTIRPKIRVAFAFTVREEGGMEHLNNGAKLFAEQHDFDYAITTEPAFDDLTQQLKIGIGCQGRSFVRVHVKGKSVHSAAYRAGVNAIYGAAEIIRRVEAHGKTFRPVEVTGRISSHPAISVTKAHGGDAENCIPDRFDLTIDRRFAIGETGDDFRREIETFTRGIDCDVDWIGDIEAIKTDFNGELYRKTVEQFEQHLGHRDEYFCAGRYDLCFFSRKTNQLINIGPGTFTAAHKDDEWVTLEGIRQCSRVLGPLLETLGD